jgi:hypothetical protein
MTEWLYRTGLLLPRLSRSVWLLAPDVSTLSAAYPIVDTVLASRPGYPLVVSVPAGEEHERASRMFEREIVLPLPFAATCRRYVHELNPLVILLAGTNEDWSAKWRHRFRLWSVPVIRAATGLAAEQISRSLPPLPKDRVSRENWRQRKGLARFVHTPLGRRAASLLDGGLLRSWDEVRNRLGAPRNILCLGNGPTADDPSLPTERFDSLFRINWRWIGQGRLDRPSLIFVGDPRVPRELGGAVLGFRTRAEADYLLMRLCLRLRRPHFDHFVYDDLATVSSTAWPARPTNGAIMVATAATLAPQRLIIAGIDLYQHPKGRYFGQHDAVDGYNRVHERDVDVALIRHALSTFSGEVDIRSAALRDALARTRNDQVGCSC